jgi:hypothetical protein
MMTMLAGFLSINMPKPLDIINYISIMRYAARAMATEGFDESVVFNCDDPAFPCQFRNGTQVLTFLEFPEGADGLREGLVGLVLSMVVYRLVAYVVMKAKV